MSHAKYSAEQPAAACPPGTFKSTQGPGLCLQCPPNSRSTAEAATICVCRNGYYRGDADQPDEPCTKLCLRSINQANLQQQKLKRFSPPSEAPGSSLAPDQSD
ncbi:Ephrin type-B receptor 2 [Liparis tanakae]|uniref:Ephrin type-B receptor 2 n=1 Tax=Liparis tanakae TaxID=230148 RepID=A0A4Z2GT31_9TELE|nr:Ephrin type-B receptor 2 [Liparis tanakae]